MDHMLEQENKKDYLADLSIEQYEQLNPKTTLKIGVKELIFNTPTKFTHWRVTSLFVKEPCTIEWLNEMGPENTLLDIGANVGMYSIWAAKIAGARVISLEPEAGNYYLLNKNIMDNKLDNLVNAYCIALSDKEEFCSLNIHDLRIGGSNHSAGEEVDCQLNPKESRFRQGCLTKSLDSMVEKNQIPIPTHIKIDVDGLEHKVILGSKKILRNPVVKSLLIEISPNLDEHKEMIQTLAELGFAYSDEQVAIATQKDGPFKGMAEYIFRR